MKTLFFDMTSGISGDIALASLFALGADIDKFSEIISKIVERPVKLSLENISRNGIKCSRLIIDADCEGEKFRYLNDISRLIAASEISEKVKGKSIEAFRILAQAESEVHGISIDEVHFHEVGALDTMIDIIGVAWCLEELSITNVLANKAIVGFGTVKTQHGILPLPAPATLKILNGVPIKQLDVEGELTTPTGAVILKCFVNRFGHFGRGTVEKDAFSTGSYLFEGATNMMRAVIFDSDLCDTKDEVLLMKTNIDDMSGENFGFLLNTLLESGAVDVSYSPAYGKKNRPLYTLSVMLPKDKETDIAKVIFRYSTTAGIRVQDVSRIIMNREIISVKIEGEIVRVKHLSYEDIEKYSPEWDDCVKVSKKLITTPIDIHCKATLLAQEG